MPQFCIIETEDGLVVAEHPEDGTAEDAAHRLGGTVIDPGPYEDYEDANDALIGLQEELLDEDGSDTPDSRPLDGRYETDAD